MMSAFKHRTAALLLFLLPGVAYSQTTDLLAGGADQWQAFDESRWQFVDSELHGSTAIFDGEKTDPDASSFLVSKESSIAFSIFWAE